MRIIEKYFSKERPVSSLHDLSLQAFTCQNWIIICHKHYKKTKALLAIKEETWSEDKTPRRKKYHILNRCRFLTCNILFPLIGTWKLYLYNSTYVIKMFQSHFAAALKNKGAMCNFSSTFPIFKSIYTYSNIFKMTHFICDYFPSATSQLVLKLKICSLVINLLAHNVGEPNYRWWS